MTRRQRHARSPEHRSQVFKHRARRQFEAWAQTYDRSLLSAFLFKPAYLACIEEICRWHERRESAASRGAGEATTARQPGGTHEGRTIHEGPAIHEARTIHEGRAIHGVREIGQGGFSLLDVGCGTGSFLSLLSALPWPVQTTGIDYTVAMGLKARDKLALTPPMDAPSPPVADGSRAAGFSPRDASHSMQTSAGAPPLSEAEGWGTDRPAGGSSSPMTESNVSCPGPPFPPGVGDGSATPPAHIVIADSEHLPFDQASFDVVTCANSFHHYPHQQTVVREIRRVLRPGGLAILVDGFRDNAVGWFVFDVVIARIEKDVHHAPWTQVRDAFTQAGLTHIHHRKINLLLPLLVTTARAP